MLRTILVDDEPLSLEALSFLLNKNENIELIGKYTDPLEALANIKETKPELVFLDIQMPELDGISAAQKIMNLGLKIHIVFTTAFDQYAVKAFEMNEVDDYIVKPFSENRLRLTVDRITQRLQNTRGKQNSAKQITNKIAVWSNNSIILLAPETIQYFTMDGKKVIARTTGDVYECNASLTDLEYNLENKGFFRCHKGFLINTEYIDKIFPWVHSTYMIKLKENNTQIPVSRHYAKKLRDMLGI
jgi:two-component system LytT family response regulator/two-component system response regulator LytT